MTRRNTGNTCPPTDLTTLTTLGNTMRDAIQAAHGRQYASKEPSGCTRHPAHPTTMPTPEGFLDTSKSKVLGYTIEWGPQRASIPKSFHPDYPDMVPIIEEITAALLAFCSAVASPRHDLTTSASLKPTRRLPPHQTPPDPVRPSALDPSTARHGTPAHDRRTRPGECPRRPSQRPTRTHHACRGVCTALRVVAAPHPVGPRRTAASVQQKPRRARGAPVRPRAPRQATSSSCPARARCRTPNRAGPTHPRGWSDAQESGQAIRRHGHGFPGLEPKIRA